MEPTATDLKAYRAARHQHYAEIARERRRKRTAARHRDALIGLLALVLVMPATAGVTGWAVAHLWALFISPLGVAHLGVWQAAGVWLTARTIFAQGGADETDDRPLWPRIVRGFFFSAFMALVVVGLGNLIARLGAP